MTLDDYTNTLRNAGQAGKTLDEALEGLGELDLVGVAEQLGMKYGAFTRALEAAHKEGREAHRLETWAVRFTTAPVEFDWMGTRRLGVAGFDKTTRKPWHKVLIDPQYVETQADRYLSGLKPTIDQGDFNKLLAYGLVVTE